MPGYGAIALNRFTQLIAVVDSTRDHRVWINEPSTTDRRSRSYVARQGSEILARVPARPFRIGSSKIWIAVRMWTPGREVCRENKQWQEHSRDDYRSEAPARMDPAPVYTPTARTHTHSPRRNRISWNARGGSHFPVQFCFQTSDAKPVQLSRDQSVMGAHRSRV